MLAIRLQRTGRSGHAQFRFIVQDSHAHPKRGKVVAYLGSYNPHAKQVTLDTEKATHYLSNGAQPSDKVARLFKAEGIKLPDWVKVSEPRERTVRNPEKLRKNRPAEPVAEAPAEESTEAAAEAPAEETAPEPAASESPAEETPVAEEATAETPSEEPAAEEPATEEANEPAPEDTAGTDTPAQ